MKSAQGEVLYVGKARNLKKRLSSYFREQVTPKIQNLVSKIADISLIITDSEYEALLLENNLIKQHMPPYNVIFRDDKSYLFLYVSEHQFPRIDKFRGKKKPRGQFFGPYTDASSVYSTLYLMKKIFKLRSCQDNYFANRSRPCLQYQIKRCSGPCVGLITPEAYQKDVDAALLLLQGKEQVVLQDLEQRMDSASAKYAYEQAAVLRDQITAIRQIQQSQIVFQSAGDIDVVVAQEAGNEIHILLLLIREGKVTATKTFKPKAELLIAEEEILLAFLQQYYFQELPEGMPKEIVLGNPHEELASIQQALRQFWQRAIKITVAKQGMRAKWLQLANKNLQEQLLQAQQLRDVWQARFTALHAHLPQLTQLEWIECFDISHTVGKQTVASCVVFGRQGKQKERWRRFNIQNITPGDDYAAMHQVLTRRFAKLKAENAGFPDLLLIDGGRGQVAIAKEVLNHLQIHTVLIVGITKGEGRKAEFDSLLLTDGSKIASITPADLGFQLLQLIRDEAHRFAIVGHRKQRAKTSRHSSLNEIEGIGSQKRQALLKYFGGLQAIKAASVQQLQKVTGINLKLAERIFKAFRE